ncbi:hypothetical protein SPHINGOAX6_70878 [Sphingomonas sp. AX6]|nr:hypothetical protein SPHINGOAX6_70878 [Sphingomonas sp. AX6]
MQRGHRGLLAASGHLASAGKGEPSERNPGGMALVPCPFPGHANLALNNESLEISPPLSCEVNIKGGMWITGSQRQYLGWDRLRLHIQ